MAVKHWLIAMALVLLAACGPGFGPNPQVYEAPIGLSRAEVAGLHARSVHVFVPDSLTVSNDPREQFPDVDIVWWEDPAGDRKAQVQAIVTAAMNKAFSELRGGTPVDVVVTVRRFHAVTPRALAGTLPAWHDITLDIELRGASGEVLARASGLKADSTALTADQARAAVARGETQKLRIQRRIVEAVQQWLESGG